MFFTGVLLGLLFVTPLVIFYFLFIRWVDRFEPEPWWLLFAALIWGALFATLGGGITSGVVGNVIAAITEQSSQSEKMNAVGATVLAPVFEEASKGLGVALIAGISALGLRELDGPLDGAIYGGVVGLGFTLTEDILYVASAYASGGFAAFGMLWFLRTVLLGLSHCTFTACTGLGFGIAAESKNRFVKISAPFFGYVFAVSLHAFHNGMPTFFSQPGAVLMILVSLVINVLFFILLGALVARDRQIVLRELSGEIGQLIHPEELQAITTYFSIGMRNLGILFSRGLTPFFDRRRKQLALVELAFLKNRRRRGETGVGMDVKETRLRQEIFFANQKGIWIGSRDLHARR